MTRRCRYSSGTTAGPAGDDRSTGNIGAEALTRSFACLFWGAVNTVLTNVVDAYFLAFGGGRPIVLPPDELMADASRQICWDTCAP
jgi:hypothetical protein